MIERMHATRIVGNLMRLSLEGPLDEATRDAELAKVAASCDDVQKAMQAAYKLGAENSVDPMRLQAAKTVLPYVRPQLQAIEAVLIDERDKGDPAVLMNQLRALIAAHPELLTALTQPIEGESTQVNDDDTTTSSQEPVVER